jgi:hypothetical protein
MTVYPISFYEEKRCLHARVRRICWKRSLGHWKFAAIRQPWLRRRASLSVLLPWATCIRWEVRAPNTRNGIGPTTRMPWAVEADTPFMRQSNDLFFCEPAGHA